MDQVTVTYVRNVLNPLETREIRQMPALRTVREYVTDVCGEGIEGYEIVASVNGCEFLPGMMEEYVVAPGDSLAFCSVPQGGGGGKAIFSLVAMLAIMVVAPYAGAALAGYGGALIGGQAAVVGLTGTILYGVGYGAVLVAGGLLMSALAPKPDAPVVEEAKSPTYSWDNVGNAIREGGTLPELFGTCRVVPPMIGTYIDTDGDKHFMNLLFAVAGHRVESIDLESIRINGNPISDFAGVSVESRLGDDTQSVMQNFKDSYADRPVQLPMKAFQITNVEATNNVRVTAPNHTFADGESVYIDGVTGPIGSHVNGNTYTVSNVSGDTFRLSLVNGLGWGAYTSGGYAAKWVVGQTSGPVDEIIYGISFPKGIWYAENDGSFSPLVPKITLEYKRVGDSVWTPCTAITTEDTVIQVSRWSVGFYGGWGGGWTEIAAGSSVFSDHKQWDVAYDYPVIGIIDGDNMIEGTTYPYVWRWILIDEVIHEGTQFSTMLIPLSESKQATLYYAFSTGRLSNRDTYDVRVRRGNAFPPTNRYCADSVFEYFQEVLSDDLSFPGVAVFSLRALATDQLSGGMPRVDVKATRGLVWVWTGSAYTAKPSSNPAWACYHLLHRARRLDNGVTFEFDGVPHDRIDYPAFNAWATYCDTVGDVKSVHLYLSQTNTLRKQLNTVSLLGRGVVVQIGSKFTALVDKADATAQKFTFGMGNIVKESYAEEFIPYDDRANAVEITYYDKDQNYEPTTVEVYAFNFDSTDREVNKAAVSLYGCVERDMAIKYGTWILNNNRLLTMVATWEAGVDAIACLPGDVVELSHDVPQFGFSGRVVGVGINLIPYSEYFDGWMDIATGVVENNATAPDGTQTADRVTGTGGGGHWIYQETAPFGANADIYTASVCVKKGTASTFILWLASHNGTWATQEKMFYNFDTGEITLEHSTTGDGGYVAHGVEPEREGYVRLWLAMKNSTGSVVSQLAFDPSYGQDGGYSYLWGAQLRKGQGPGVYAKNVNAVYPSGLTLDRDVTIEPGNTYQIAVRHQDTDVVEERNVSTDGGGVSLTTATIDVSVAWTNTPAPLANYAFGKTGQVSKKFRVLSIDRESDLTYRIKAIEYDPNVYSDSATVPPITPPSALEKVTNLIATEVWRSDAGVGLSHVSLAWSGMATRWNVWYTRTDRNWWSWVGATTKPSFRMDNLPWGETYTFVVAGDQEGFTQGKSVQIALAGKSSGPSGGVPSLVPQFDDSRCSFTDKVYLAWGEIAEPNIAGYEVRRGPTWESGAVMFKGVGTSLVWDSYSEFPTTTTFTFRIKAFDVAGIYCEGEDTVTVTVPVMAAPTGVGVVATYGKITITWNGIEDPLVMWVEVWRNTTNNFNTSSLIGAVAGDSYVDTQNIVGGLTYYYWLVAKNKYGQYGNLSSEPNVGHSSGAVPLISTADVANNAISQIKLAADLVVPEVLAALPSLPDANYPIGKLVFYTADGKLYRNRLNVWTAEVSFADVWASSFDNMVGNPRFDGGRSDTWSMGDWELAQAGGATQWSARAQLKQAYSHMYSIPIRVVGGTSYFVAMDYVFSTDADAAAYTNIWIDIRDKNGAQIGSAATQGLGKVTSWTRAELKFTLPSNADYIYIAPYYYSTVTVGQVYVTNFYMKRAVNTELIVDGAIKAAQITTNAIETQHIKADAIVASKIAVVSRGMALNSDPHMTDAGAWIEAGYGHSFVDVADAPVGSRVMRSPTGNGGYFYTAAEDVKLAPINSEKTYRITGRFRGAGSNGITGFIIQVYDKDKIYMSNVLAAPWADVPDSWNQYTYIFGYGTVSPIPSQARFAKLQIILNLTDTSTGYVECQDVRWEERIPGELIVDGAISADKIAANCITAGQIAAGAIGADEIAANVVATKHLVLADFTNIIPNPSFLGGDSTQWTKYLATIVAKGTAGVPANAPTDYVAVLPQSNGYIFTPAASYYDCAPDEEFYLGVMCASDPSVNGNLQMYLQWYDKDGTPSGSSVLLRGGASQPWGMFSGIVTAPAGARKFAYVLMNQSTAGTWYVTQPRVRKAAGGSLIVDGAITAEKIQAGSVSASKLAVTGGAATLNIDPLMTDVNSWSTYGPSFPPNIIDVTDAPAGVRVLQGRVPPDGVANHYGSEYIAFTPTKSYRISAFIRKTVAGADGSVYIGVACYDQAKTWISNPPNLYATLNVSPTTSWNKYSKVVVPSDFPPLTRWVQAFVIVGYSATVGYIQACDIRLEEVIPGELIVNGAITTDKIGANQVTAEKLSFSNLAGLNAAEGAKLAGIAEGATVNRVTYSGTAPSDPVDGDIWIDTSASPDTVKVRVSGAWQEGATLGALSAQIADISNAQLTGQSVNYGKMLHRDPRFKVGTNGANVYNNNGGSAVTIERVTPPTDSPNYGVIGTYDMKVNYFTATPPYSTPGWGGFSFGDGTRPNIVLVTKIVAKIPVGRSIMFATNSIGDGGSSKWLTPTAGTGRYEEYLMYVRGGTSGSFASTNYFYISGGADASFSWWVSFATSFDLTDVDGAHDGVTLQNINNGLVITGGGLTLSSGGSSIKSGNYALPSNDNTSAGVGFKIADSGNIEAYGMAQTFGGAVISSDGNYMVSIGRYLSGGSYPNAGLFKRYPLNNDSNFVTDGRIHVYYWDTSGTPQWKDVAWVGMGSSAGTNSIIRAANWDASTENIPVTGYSPKGRGGYFIADGAGGTFGIEGLATYPSGGGIGGKFSGDGGAVLLVPRYSASYPTNIAPKGTLAVTSDGVLCINVNGSTTWGTCSDFVVEASYADTSAHTIWSHTPKVGGTTAYIVEVLNVATGGAETGDGSYYLREYVVTNPSGTPVNIVNTLRQGTGNLNGNVQPVVGISGGQVYINVQNTTSGYTVKYRVRVKVTEV